MIRTYNSLNPRSGDFGHSWTYAITDIEMSIDEQREETEDVDGEFFSMRVPDSQNGRNVTMTLPDGRRTTFTFSLEPGGSSCLCYHAKWKAAPGIHATLVPTVSDKLITLPGGLIYWQASGLDTPWEGYDFPGFILTTKDGTQYRVERESLGEHFVLDEFGEQSFVQARGKCRLKRITDRTGNRIEINPDSIDHYMGVEQPSRSQPRWLRYLSGTELSRTTILIAIAPLQMGNCSA